MDIYTSYNNDSFSVKFCKHVLPELKSFHYSKLLKRDEDKITQIVLKELKVTSKYELNDKFEGAAFLKNYLNLFSTLIAIHLKLGLKFDIDTYPIIKLKNNKLKFGKLTYRIINFRFGEVPLFKYEENWIKDGIIFALHRDERFCYICGFMSSSTIKQLYQDQPFVGSTFREDMKEFLHFKNLECIENIITNAELIDN